MYPFAEQILAYRAADPARRPSALIWKLFRLEYSDRAYFGKWTADARPFTHCLGGLQPANLWQGALSGATSASPLAAILEETGKFDGKISELRVGSSPTRLQKTRRMTQTAFRDKPEHPWGEVDAGNPIVQEVFGFVKRNLSERSEGWMPLAEKGVGKGAAALVLASAHRDTERDKRSD